MTTEAPPTEAPLEPLEPAKPAAWRRWLWLAILVAVLLASVIVFVTAPRAPSSQAAMGQGLPNTSLGTVRLEALEVGFLPEGYAFVIEETDGNNRVTQQYRNDSGPTTSVIVVTSVLGTFDRAATLAADPDAEEINVDGAMAVVQRTRSVETGDTDFVVRIQVDSSHNVIVRGIGAVPRDDVVAVAASVSAP